MATPLDPQIASQIADRLTSLRQKITDAAILAGRAAQDIRLLGVSKKQEAFKLETAYKLGLRDFGENYVQGLEEHQEDLPHKDVRWHFIGHLQSKKVRKILGCHLFHSLDSIKLAQKLHRAACEEERCIEALVNVNISEEGSKSGIVASEFAAFVEEVEHLSSTSKLGLKLRGSMCIPDPAKEAQEEFAKLRELQASVQTNSDMLLDELSMGMSDSFEAAIAEGATIVRVGTGIFGPRLSL